MTYWERLNHLKLYSLERRRERYIIIYVFKIIHSLVPNPGIEWHENSRSGIYVTIPKASVKTPHQVKILQQHSFFCVGPKFYNSIPRELRRVFSQGLHPVNQFKRILDKFLSGIPDQPTVAGLTRAATSNSIIDQVYCIAPV